MNSCPSCGTEPPQGARFCPSCGASLAAAPKMATERKVVTTLFADLVGFTALSERFDPEDVDAALRGYFEMSRKTIERFTGGLTGPQKDLRVRWAETMSLISSITIRRLSAGSAAPRTSSVRLAWSGSLSNSNESCQRSGSP